MKILKIFLGLLIVTSVPLAAQQASSLDELLQNVEQGKVQDASDNQKRENEFNINNQTGIISSKGFIEYGNSKNIFTINNYDNEIINIKIDIR